MNRDRNVQQATAFLALIFMLGVCVGCEPRLEHEMPDGTAEEHEVSPYTAPDDDASDPDEPKKPNNAASEPAPAPDPDPVAAPVSAAPAKGVQLVMPGKSFAEPLPALTDEQRAIAAALRKDVERLAGQIGERSVRFHPKLIEAAGFIDGEFVAAGYRPQRQTFDTKGRACDNVEAELAGSREPEKIVVVGAHYDSAAGTPGANDNGSGVAALLALARRLAGAKPACTVRFVAFANEENPYFGTDQMGSLVYARRCRQRKEDIVAMLSLETIGYYSDAPDSQKYPIPFNIFYPSTGNFIGFIGNVQSGELVKQVVTVFRREAKFPSEGGALPAEIDGVGWSDHWAFWQAGYSAVMVTDTAPFRYPHYHAAEDTPDKLDYDRMARVVEGLDHVVRDLAD